MYMIIAQRNSSQQEDVAREGEKEEYFFFG